MRGVTSPPGTASLSLMKIKRRREDDDMTERKTQLRKLGRETQLLFRALSLADGKPLRQRHVQRNKSRTVVRTEKSLEVERALKEATQKRAIPEARRDYLFTVYNRLYPDADRPLTMNEEVIEAYKFCTDERERRLLRRNFAVVREMALIEEGIATDLAGSESSWDDDCESFAYYVDNEGETPLEQYFDEEGNLREGVQFEICDEDRSDPDEELKSVHDYPSDSDSNRGYFEMTEDEDEELVF